MGSLSLKVKRAGHGKPSHKIIVVHGIVIISISLRMLVPDIMQMYGIPFHAVDGPTAPKITVAEEVYVQRPFHPMGMTRLARDMGKNMTADRMPIRNL